MPRHVVRSRLHGDLDVEVLQVQDGQRPWVAILLDRPAPLAHLPSVLRPTRHEAIRGLVEAVERQGSLGA